MPRSRDVKISLYVLIGVALVLVFGAAILISEVVKLGNKLDDQITRVETLKKSQAEQANDLYVGCVHRSNPQRRVNVFLLKSALADAKIVAESAANDIIRDRFERKQTELQRKLDSLVVPLDFFRSKKSKYLVDCKAAYLHQR